jgi:lycopene cyclase domain-containing protein
MEFQNFWYLIILIVTATVSIYLIVKKTNNFLVELKYMLPAIIFSGAIFTILNIRFSEAGIISFNYNYLVGKNILYLPIEEWLFLLVISLLSFAIYQQVKIKFDHFEKPNLFLAISLVFIVVFGLVAWFSRTKPVTFFIFFLLTVYLSYTIFRNRFKQHITKFYIALIISVIPFFLFKGILNSLPVVLYNNEYNLGIQIYGVPVEDFGYFFLLMLINITIFEYLREKSLY